MNSLKVFFTLAVLVISAFVMIYVAEGIYEARASSPMSLSIAPLPGSQDVTLPKEDHSFMAPLKKVLRQAEETVHPKPAEQIQETNTEAEEIQVHHGLCVAAMTGDLEKTKALLNAGISANVRDSFNIRAIARATLWGHYEVVKALLEKGANVNERERLGVTLLMLAANKGDKALLELFLEYGADASMQSEDGETALSIANKKGYVELVEILQAHNVKSLKPLGKKIKEKRSPFAIKKKAGLEELINQDETKPDLGFDALERMELHSDDNTGTSAESEKAETNALDALTWAANASKESIEVIEAEMIEEILARENATEVRKFEPEPQAADFKISDRELVVVEKPQAAAKPTAAPVKIEAYVPAEEIVSQETASLPQLNRPALAEGIIKPQAAAAKTGRELMAERAVTQKRIKVDESEVSGEEPVLISRASKPKVEIEADLKSDVSHYSALLPSNTSESDVKLEEQSYIGKESWVDPEMLERLPSKEELDTIYEEVKSIEVDLSDWSQKEIDAYRQQGPVVFNPDDLMQAVLAGAMHRVRVVIDYGVDVNSRGDLEMTPLMVAAQSGRTDLVQFLLTHGADVHAQNIVGQTALRLAMLKENTDVIKILKTYGARE